MSIPKIIVQTFKNDNLPFLTKWHIRNLKKNNPAYNYQFFGDAEVDNFIEMHFDAETFHLFKQIQIGAAKADFFRYAFLYMEGGIYLDIDSQITGKLDDLILPTDKAVISHEKNLEYYVQWALIYEAGHPFLKRTLEIIKENIRWNKFPYNSHQMTGPTAYTQAIKECIAEGKGEYRAVDYDYNQQFRFSYPMSKFFLYGIFRKGHWKKEGKIKSVLRK